MFASPPPPPSETNPKAHTSFAFCFSTPRCWLGVVVFVSVFLFSLDEQKFVEVGGQVFDKIQAVIDLLRGERARRGGERDRQTYTQTDR